MHDVDESDTRRTVGAIVLGMGEWVRAQANTVLGRDRRAQFDGIKRNYYTWELQSAKRANRLL